LIPSLDHMPTTTYMLAANTIDDIDFEELMEKHHAREISLENEACY
jgi:hypothetical protein